MNGRLWRLQVPGQPVRGAYVSLGQDWADLVADRGYGEAAASLLGQALAAMPLLMVHLKTAARLSLQISQAPPLSLLTVQGSTQGAVRGMIKLDGDELDPADLSGQLVVTLEPENSEKRFQGIVPLEGSNLAQWLARYFEQSEQVPTALLLCADQQRAGGILLQAMPGEDAELDWKAALNRLDVDYLPEVPGEWLSAMLGFDLSLSESDSPVTLACQCSEQTVANMLLQLGQEELDQVLAEQGEVSVECGFCGQAYAFDSAKVEDLFAGRIPPPHVN